MYLFKPIPTIKLATRKLLHSYLGSRERGEGAERPRRASQRLILKAFRGVQGLSTFQLSSSYLSYLSFTLSTLPSPEGFNKIYIGPRLPPLRPPLNTSARLGQPLIIRLSKLRRRPLEIINWILALLEAELQAYSTQYPGCPRRIAAFVPSRCTPNGTAR